MITSTIHVLILIPVFFFIMQSRSLGRPDAPATQPQEIA